MCRRAAPAREAARSVSSARFRGALSPMRSPRVPPVTMLGLRRTAPLGGGGPNIVKDGTPARARCRRPPLRVGHLTLEAPTSRVHVSARRTAPYRRAGGPATSSQRRATAGRGLLPVPCSLILAPGGRGHRALTSTRPQALKPWVGGRSSDQRRATSDRRAGGNHAIEQP